MPEILKVVQFGMMFFIQNYLMFRLASKIADYRINHHFTEVVSVVNVVLFIILSYYFSNNTVLVYTIITIIFIVGTTVLFKAHITVLLSCALALPIHLMAIRNIVVSVYQIISGVNNEHVQNSAHAYWNSFAITSVICSIFIVSLLIVIPTKYFKMMNQQRDKMILFVVLSLLACARLIINGFVYSNNYSSPTLVVQQIATGAGWMMVLYTGVFMLMGFELMEATKDKLQNRLVRERLFRKAMSINSEMLLEVNCTENTIAHINIKGENKDAITGSCYSDYISDNIQNFVHVKDRGLVREKTSLDYITRSYENGICEIHLEYRIYLDDGECQWHKLVINTETNNTNTVVAVFNIENIHQEKIKELELKFKAERDPLVGAYNKRTVQLLIEEHIKNNGVGAMIMIDLDNFKSINDTYGHSYGDKVLCDVNSKLNEIFREDDIVGRIGGDEFLVYLKDITEPYIITEKAKKVCAEIKTTYHLQGKPSVTISSSVGIAINPTHGNSFKELFDDADIAMYKSKSEGKSTFNIFNYDMQKNEK